MGALDRDSALTLRQQQLRQAFEELEEENFCAQVSCVNECRFCVTIALAILMATPQLAR
jgi:hypothetical protein